MTKIWCTIKTEKLSFKYQISVSKTGVFYTALPEETTQELLKYGIKVGYSNLHKRYGYFESDSLQGLKQKVEDAIQSYNSKQLVYDKIVIRYAIDTVCSYCKLKSGTIVPNGGWQQEVEGDYNWISGTVRHDATNPAPYGFSIYVSPERLRIYKFVDGSEYKEYSNLHDEDFKYNSNLHWLDSVCSMGRYNGSNLKEVEYNEDVAKFFKEIILYVCNLNEKLKFYFGDKITLNQNNLKQIKFME